MHRVIAIANPESRAGKTTTAINLATALVANQLRVLLIDLDPQARATKGCGFEKAQLPRTVRDVVLGHASMASGLVPVNPGGFTLLGSSRGLSDVEARLGSGKADGSKLRKAMEPQRDAFDVILMDCPSSIGVLTVNALVAADSVLIPFECDYVYGLEGLGNMMLSVERVRRTGNASLEIEGILRTMYDPRNLMTTNMSKQIIGTFGDKVLRTVIPRNIKVAEALFNQQPVAFFDRQSQGAMSYMDLATELIQRHSGAGPTGAAALSRPR